MKKLLFIYNAKSGVFNGLLDFAHKSLSPETYECDLCFLTYGNFGMKAEWKAYIQSLQEKYQVEFLHKDQLENYPSVQHVSLPSVVIFDENQSHRVLVSSKQFKEFEKLEDLIGFLDSTLS